MAYMECLGYIYIYIYLYLHIHTSTLQQATTYDFEVSISATMPETCLSSGAVDGTSTLDDKHHAVDE